MNNVQPDSFEIMQYPSGIEGGVSPEAGEVRDPVTKAGEVFAAVTNVAEQTGNPVDRVMAGLVDDTNEFAQENPGPETTKEAIVADVAGAFKVLDDPDSPETAAALADSPPEVLGPALEIIDESDPSGEAVEVVTGAIDAAETGNGVQESSFEMNRVAEIGERQELCEREYTAQLHDSLAAYLEGIGANNRAMAEVIESDSQLRAAISHACEFFSIDTQSLGIDLSTAEQADTGVETDPQVAHEAQNLAESAGRVNEGFQVVLAGTAGETGSLYVEGPVKKPERIAEKAINDYVGDVNQVKDAVRGRIVIDGDPTVQDEDIVEKIRAQFSDAQKGRITKVKRPFINTMTGEAIPVEKWSRYLDTKVSVEVVDQATGGVVTGEIAIVTPEMAAATKVEHPLYEIIRTQEAVLEKAGQENPSKQLQLEFVAGLKAQVNAFYRGVAQGIQSRITS